MATWDLSGDDAGDFNISSGGVLTFKTRPTSGPQRTRTTDNVYMVTVEATDGTNDATQDRDGDRHGTWTKNGTFSAMDYDAGQRCHRA